MIKIKSARRYRWVRVNSSYDIVWKLFHSQLKILMLNTHIYMEAQEAHFNFLFLRFNFLFLRFNFLF